MVIQRIAIFFVIVPIGVSAYLHNVKFIDIFIGVLLTWYLMVKKIMYHLMTVVWITHTVPVWNHWVYADEMQTNVSNAGTMIFVDLKKLLVWMSLSSILLMHQWLLSLCLPISP